MKISQNFVESPLKISLISQISAKSLWHVCIRAIDNSAHAQSKCNIRAIDYSAHAQSTCNIRAIDNSAHAQSTCNIRAIDNSAHAQSTCNIRAIALNSYILLYPMILSVDSEALIRLQIHRLIWAFVVYIGPFLHDMAQIKHKWNCGGLVIPWRLSTGSDVSVIRSFLSRKLAYIILTPWNPTFM